MPVNDMMVSAATPDLRLKADPDQLAADQELYAQLQADEFEGARYQHLRDDLWVYGWRVIRKWMRDGTIIARCRERDVHFAAPYTEVEDMMRRADFRDEIAHDCVSAAITKFMTAMRGGDGWTPDGGATMRTFLVVYCLHDFRDAYRRWAVPRRRRLYEITDGIWRGPQLPWDQPVVELTPADMMEMRGTLDLILDEANLEERAICQLILSTGATQEQIARELGTTRKSVERRMARLRKRALALAVAIGIDMCRPSVQSGAAR
ncbi:hypothetical protein OG982_30125 [Streptomyces sp. NBC_01551]|uniref:hypothetical protein n=1 Tax=Streptomyces sp. NBC_01551 TaxID=2975876 RepID=UPI002259B9EF|nr:hypothetical protein [Streptomyces sp. NBC_01551]MCX4529902.1 hypothetical protein [Streptomyces sp. NBC_01551]